MASLIRASEEGIIKKMKTHKIYIIHPYDSVGTPSQNENLEYDIAHRLMRDYGDSIELVRPLTEINLSMLNSERLQKLKGMMEGCDGVLVCGEWQRCSECWMQVVEAIRQDIPIYVDFGFCLKKFHNFPSYNARGDEKYTTLAKNILAFPTYSAEVIDGNITRIEIPLALPGGSLAYDILLDTIIYSEKETEENQGGAKVEAMAKGKSYISYGGFRYSSALAEAMDTIVEHLQGLYDNEIDDDNDDINRLLEGLVDEDIEKIEKEEREDNIN